MAEIVKIYQEQAPPSRFIGIRYGEDHRLGNSFAHLWQAWFEHRRFEPLERLVDDSWRGGRRTRLVAEVRQLTGGMEAGRPVTHLVYAAPSSGSPGIFHPEPALLEELAEFREGWDRS